MFVFYTRKMSILIFMGSIITLGVLGIGLAFHQSRQVFKAEVPITQGNTAKKCVSISVNVDWGQEYIPDMLEILRQHHVQATFFITGRWAETNGQLVQQIDLGGARHRQPRILTSTRQRPDTG